MYLLAEINSSLAGVLVLAGLIALVFTLGRLIRKHKNLATRDAGAGPQLPSARAQADAEARLRETAERLMAEIETMARESRAEVETRVRVLAELLARADAAIEKLPGEEPVPPPPRFEEVYRLADEGLDAAAIAGRTSFERGEVELILGVRTRTTASGRVERVERPRPRGAGEDRA
ncbi:MAG: hypothetical protein ACYTKD_05630 [Planctomycetota bacterium]|jgi:hypothetical protein